MHAMLNLCLCAHSWTDVLSTHTHLQLHNSQPGATRLCVEYLTSPGASTPASAFPDDSFRAKIKSSTLAEINKSKKFFIQQQHYFSIQATRCRGLRKGFWLERVRSADGCRPLQKSCLGGWIEKLGVANNVSLKQPICVSQLKSLHTVR